MSIYSHLLANEHVMDLMHDDMNIPLAAGIFYICCQLREELVEYYDANNNFFVPVGVPTSDFLFSPRRLLQKYLRPLQRLTLVLALSSIHYVPLGAEGLEPFP